LTPLISAMLAKADRKLATARRSHVAGDWEQTASSAYYEAFHAVSALLESRGLSFSSHGQTLGAFNKEFVATGLFPREAGRTLSRLFDDLQDSDYELEVIISEEMAATDLADAAEIILRCRVLLGVSMETSSEN
jgi:uncharacterized protein (UPF0332 family)